LALCLAGSFSYSNAQTVDSTGNLINNNNWSGVGAYAPDPNDCCSNPAGSQPLYDTATDTIKFSYGQATVEQSWAINQALQGTGIQVHGYTYQFDIRNMNGSGGQHGTDSLTANTWLTNSLGQVIHSTSTVVNTQIDWTTFNGTRTLSSPMGTTDLGSAGIAFMGMDGGFWAGLYGPEVRNVSFRLNYSSDPCAVDPLSSPTCPGYAEAYKNLMCSNNPLYDTTCAGYSAVVSSGNLVPYPGGTNWGGSVNNSFAVNQALSHAGSGVMIHGFDWGYRAYNHWGIFSLGQGSSTTNVNIRDGDGTSLHAWSRSNTALGENWHSGRYVLPQSQNNLTMGTFEFTASASGLGFVDNMWVRALFTPDSCSLDPLSSVLCTKYEEAFLAQQCSITALFSPQCPGYIDAMNEMLAQSMPTGVEDTTQVAVAPTSTVSSTGTAAQDDTRDPTEITTDVGGVELSTTGEIKVADAVPSAAKESAKQSDAKSDNEEKKTLSKDQLKAIAARAVRETEQTALAAADAAVEQSQSEAANPSDGTGATVDLGGGLSLRSLQAMTMAGQLQAGPERLPDRTSEDDRVRSQQITTAADAVQTTIEQTVNVLVVQDQSTEETPIIAKDSKDDSQDLASVSVTSSPPPEPVAPSGPAVRRGGKVEGMEGGADINSLTAAPADFNDYLNQQLQDAQFYASRDIYRGQRNVDNARALRGLGTDRLHQEMINQQYGGMR
jgi:hypothetical protein